MKVIWSLLFVVVFPWLASAQEDNSLDQWIKILGYGISNQSRATQLTIEEVKTRESQCFPSQFMNCNLLLSNNSTVEEVSAKYDFRENLVLIQYKGRVAIAAPNMIREMNCRSATEEIKLINVSEMGRTFGRKGFYEILSEDRHNKLVCHRYMGAIPPAYNATLDIGIRDTTFNEKKEYLLYKDHKAYALENFKSKTLGQFDEHQSSLKSFIKKEKLKFKEEEDLKKFAQYFWSL